MHKHDFIFLLLLAMAGLCITAFIYLPEKHEGSTVIIRENGSVTHSLPLSTDQTFTIHTKNGQNTITIQNGSVSVTAADCKDQICIQKGKISKNGESIICLPHQLSIEIEGENTKLDGISGRRS